MFTASSFIACTIEFKGGRESMESWAEVCDSNKPRRPLQISLASCLKWYEDFLLNSGCRSVESIAWDSLFILAGSVLSSWYVFSKLENGSTQKEDQTSRLSTLFGYINKDANK